METTEVFLDFVVDSIRRADRKVYWSHIDWDNNHDPDPILVESAGFVFDEIDHGRVLLDARRQCIDN